MSSGNIATGLLTATALVYASSSLLLNQLSEVGGETLPEFQMREHRKTIHLSIAASFFCVSISIALLASSMTSGLAVEFVAFGVSDRLVIWIGSLFLVAAVAFPSYSAMWLSLDIYGEYSDFSWPR